jgi:DNA-binding beta-propeller fold protein YncE
VVQVLLKSEWRRGRGLLALVCVLLSALTPFAQAASKTSKSQPISVPELELEGGRRLTFERSFWAEPQVKLKRGFWTRLIDIVAGAPDFHALISPYEVVEDSRGRFIVSDPGAAGIHIFDFPQQKYKFIARERDDDNGLEAPQCLAVDANDNIYATDSLSGKIFVFGPNGKFQRMIGSLKGGEGYFKRPTGIAVDSAAQRIYVTDTLRDQIFVLDMQGNILKTMGKKGQGDVEFNYPTELRLSGDNLIVVDAMNFRVQVLDRSGNFRYAIGRIGEGTGEMFRPKGIGIDSEGHLYVVEAVRGMVQVFDNSGQLLYYFGQRGSGFGEFQLPTGLWIDSNDRVLVVDSYNRRVQVFQYVALGKQGAGGAH